MHIGAEKSACLAVGDVGAGEQKVAKILCEATARPAVFSSLK